jgi:hypothetical protein
MMKDPLHVYLNDHLAGATAGVDLVKSAAERHEGDMGDFFAQLADEISADYNTLTSLIAQLNAQGSGVKEAMAKAGAEFAEDKFSGETIGHPTFGTFITLETLSIGVEGKLCMWKALRCVQGDITDLAGADIDGLIERAQSQRDRIEGKRLEIAGGALVTSSPVNA